jgi:hypothetical protein
MEVAVKPSSAAATSAGLIPNRNGPILTDGTYVHRSRSASATTFQIAIPLHTIL